MKILINNFEYYYYNGDFAHSCVLCYDCIIRTQVLNYLSQKTLKTVKFIFQFYVSFVAHVCVNWLSLCYKVSERHKAHLAKFLRVLGWIKNDC